MNKRPAVADDQFFRNLADREEAAVPAPGRLKARIYSALVRETQKESSLRTLSETRQAGYELCQWEKIMQVVPGAGHVNHCRVCHARVMGESLAHAPLPWSGCPYAQFHRP